MKHKEGLHSNYIQRQATDNRMVKDDSAVRTVVKSKKFPRRLLSLEEERKKLAKSLKGTVSPWVKAESIGTKRITVPQPLTLSPRQNLHVFHQTIHKYPYN
ncbi:hypothetical protein PoB_006689300 [Plakobranchus ocellatus]|uniref:Uncharacterized protein n=1 Tax=Plakobranchus ocellatus TaxID=259542 RepID=A0AAV4D8K5_9GAST|nr:hypothetical protein PoB_006689300 [Plakobranchus ocellatus]